MKAKPPGLFYKKGFSIILILLAALTVSIQTIITVENSQRTNDREYFQHNNYIIFKQSFIHLLEGKDLYAGYPDEHWDLYKYTPTFAALFGFFTLLPDTLGLTLWNLINASVLLLSLLLLPSLDHFKRNVVSLILLIELITSMQNEQSNALMAGLLVLAFSFLERKTYLWAAFCLVFSVYIKLFGLIGFSLLLIYPNRIKVVMYSLFWFILFALVPFLFISWEQYVFLIKSYAGLLVSDHNISYGLSLHGGLYKWFGLELKKITLLIIGAIMYLIPFAQFSLFKNANFRQLVLSSLLIWLVLFNHKAESPTFVIAYTGIAIWYITIDKKYINQILIVLAIVIGSFSSTDLYPTTFREEIAFPYMFKTMPSILIWLKIMWDLISFEGGKPFFVRNKLK